MRHIDEYYGGVFGGELGSFPGDSRADRIESFFRANGVGMRVSGVEAGPVVTRYAVELEGDTDRVSRVEALRRDLGLRLGVGASRVYIGESEWRGGVSLTIEVPNAERVAVPSGCVVPECGDGPGLRVCLGVDASGRPFSVDLARAPHVLVAGQSGSGKSVFLDSLVCGLVANRPAHECTVAIVDPKGTEFCAFEGHQSVGVPGGRRGVVGSDGAVGLVERLVEEMEERNAMLRFYGCRTLAELHARGVYYHGGVARPYIVAVVDEFYDLVTGYGDAFAGPLSVLAAKARSTGIHLVLATQRPSADVIRGALKANLSTRVALKVASRTDSQVILDRPGAESLCGRGDMLYMGPDGDAPRRLHGCWLPESEVAEMVRRARESEGSPDGLWSACAG